MDRSVVRFGFDEIASAIARAPSVDRIFSDILGVRATALGVSRCVCVCVCVCVCDLCNAEHAEHEANLLQLNQAPVFPEGGGNGICIGRG